MTRANRMQTNYIGAGGENPLTKREADKLPKLKDPGSAITHMIALAAALIGTPPLLLHTARLGGGPLTMLGMTAFMAGMILLYAASSIYHAVDSTPRVNAALRRLDHMMIFILIAGSYTPVCLVGIGGAVGHKLLAIVWGIAAVGILVKAFWITSPKWFSSVIYIGMGWVCLLAFPQILANLSRPAFLWLLVGGIIYTVGGVLYALKLQVFNNKFPHFGSHEVFHLFVMAGSACHYVMMFVYLAPMGRGL